MRDFFKRLFTRKQHIAIDTETTGIDGQSIISVNDIAAIIRDTKNDFNKLTMTLNAMQDVMENADPAVKHHYEYLLKKTLSARTINYDVGVDIENLERIMHQRIPSLKNAVPTVWVDMADPVCEIPNDL